MDLYINIIYVLLFLGRKKFIENLGKIVLIKIVTNIPTDIIYMFFHKIIYLQIINRISFLISIILIFILAKLKFHRVMKFALRKKCTGLLLIMVSILMNLLPMADLYYLNIMNILLIGSSIILVAFLYIDTYRYYKKETGIGKQ